MIVSTMIKKWNDLLLLTLLMLQLGNVAAQSVDKSFFDQSLNLYSISQRSVREELNITGHTSPESSIAVYREGSVIGRSYANASGDFVVSVSLETGANNLQVESLGLQLKDPLQESFPIFYDPLPSEIITQDTEKTKELAVSKVGPLLHDVSRHTNNNPVFVTGETSPGSLVNVFANGRKVSAVKADELGAFSANVPLLDGENRLYAAVKGALGDDLISDSVLVNYEPVIQRSSSVGGTLSQNEVWTSAGSPYLVSTNLIIPLGLTLTIQEGVEVRFAYRVGIQVDGNLDVAGTAMSPVILTADDAAPAINDWNGIAANTSTSVVTLDHATVQWASNALSFANGGTGLITNSVLQNNRYGVFISHNSSPVIDGNNTITGNQYGLFVTSISTTIANTKPVLRANAVHNNVFYNYYTTSSGVSAGQVLLDATGNWWGSSDIEQIRSKIYDYTNATSSPVVDFSGFLDMTGGMPVYSGSSLSGIISGQQSLAVDNYLVLGNVTVPAGSHLTLTEGTVLTFSSDDLVLAVEGELSINGTAGSPVVLTSDNPGVSRTWEGIKFASGSIGTIQHLLLQAATNGIYIDDGYVTVDYTTIENAYSSGIYFLNGGSGLVENSLIQNNRYGIFVGNESSPVIDGNNEIASNQYGIYVSSNFLTVSSTSPVVRNNKIHANTLFNYYSSSSGTETANYTLNATGNWWGSEDYAVISGKIYDHADASTSQPVNIIGFKDIAGIEVVSLYETMMSSHELHPYNEAPVNIDFTLNTDANVKLEVVRESDDIVLYQNESMLLKGQQQLSWDGRDNNSLVVADDLYRIRLSANRNQDSFTLDPNIPPGLGSVGLVDAFPTVMNPHRNEAFSLQLSAVQPVLLTMQVNPGNGLPVFNHLEGQFIAPGTYDVFWDGRNPDGSVVNGQTYIWFPAPVKARPFALNIHGNKPAILGTETPPKIGIKSDPFLITHSYEQISQVAYQLDQDAFVTFKLLPPGIYDPDDLSAITLLNHVLQQAEDGMGGALNHSVEWRGYDLQDTNQILTSDEGVYTFVIEAESPASGLSSLYRGALQIRQ